MFTANPSQENAKIAFDARSTDLFPYVRIQLLREDSIIKNVRTKFLFVSGSFIQNLLNPQCLQSW